MDETAPMEMSECRCQADSDPQKLSQFPRFAHNARKDLAAVILNQKCGTSMMTI